MYFLKIHGRNEENDIVAEIMEINNLCTEKLNQYGK